MQQHTIERQKVEELQKDLSSIPFKRNMMKTGGWRYQESGMHIWNCKLALQYYRMKEKGRKTKG